MWRLVAVLMLLPVAAFAQEKKGVKYAFIVAVGQYDETTTGLKPLPYTVRDVTGFREALLATGYEDINIRLLHDQLPADKNPGLRFVPKQKEIMRELANLVRFADPEDSIIVVLNGHGVHFKGSKTSHFCPLDADLGAKTNLIPLDGPGGLYPLLETCKAKSKLLIAGMCRNDPKEFPADSQAAEQIDLSTPETPPVGIAALYSCEAGQKTYFDKDKGSYFFKHLSAAWRGEYASEDELTLDAVFASVRARTKREVFEVTGGARDQFPEVRRKYDGVWNIPKAVRQEPKGGDEREFEIFKGVKMRFCWIPPGKTTLGSPAEDKERREDEKEHPHETKGFWLGKYEVTQGEYEGVTGTNPSAFQGAKLPAETVSWDDCQKFIAKCEVKGMKLKLPHEDDWEYACRGGKGNQQAYYWGDALDGDKANHKGANKEKTTEVGSYASAAKHPWGLCDMAGNVSEWCDNLYATTSPARVFRGGSWLSAAKGCRSAHRVVDIPSARLNSLGFRLVLVPS